MAYLQETATWEDGIYQLEVTDPVLGGPDGVDNLAPKQLANRTLYLKGKAEDAATAAAAAATEVQAIKDGSRDFTTQAVGNNSRRPATTAFVQANKGGFSGYVSVTGAGSIAKANAGKLIGIGDGSFTTTLAALSGFTDSDVITISKVGTGVAKIAANGTEKIINSVGENASVFLYRGESITLVKAGTAWFVLNDGGLFGSVGDIIYSNKIKSGTLALDGSLISRAEYPRLYEFALSTGIVSESTWSNGAYGLFSSGDGSTSFRLPNTRGYFTRAVNPSTGMDTNRALGWTQADDFKAHSHGGIQLVTFTSTSGSELEENQGGAGYKINPISSGSAGGSETRPVNIALYQLIKF